MELKNRNSRTPEKTVISGISLKAVWDVNETEKYDVSRSEYKNIDKNDFIAIRTLKGLGRLYIKDNNIIDLSPETLIILEAAILRRYRCLKENWRFWWFEFNIFEAINLPLNIPFSVSYQKSEWHDFNNIFTYLRRDSSSERQYALAVFSMMLHRWMIQSEQQQRSRYFMDITRVIDKIHDFPGKNWSIKEMAKFANMSERNFRSVFQKITGLPPKKYFEQIRLNDAKELLEIGIYNVQQVSEKFGYSSPFHFSKNFTKFFGYPPSKV